MSIDTNEGLNESLANRSNRTCVSEYYSRRILMADLFAILASVGIFGSPLALYARHEIKRWEK